MIVWNEQYLTDRLRGLITQYADAFGEGPPMLQIAGDLFEQAVLIERAIDRGEEIRDDEIVWPSSPGELL